jgi:RND family efflux transporter MFP subunit
MSSLDAVTNTGAASTAAAAGSARRAVRGGASPAALLALIVLGGAALAGCGKGDAAGGPKTRPPPLVVVTKVEGRDVPVEIDAPVDLRPIEQADVGSKVLGYIDAVLVDRGDKVKRGQPLALVRPSDLPDQLAAARGTLAQTQASVALARANAERAQKLRPAGVVSQGELDSSSAALQSAQAAEAAAKAQLAALGVRLGETRIESPLTGVVLGRRLDPGALVGPPGGGAIVTVARTDVLRCYVTVNERSAGQVAVGQEAHVEVDALPGKSFTGKVVRLSPGFDATTRTLDAEVQLDNKEGELRPGMYGRAGVRLGLHPKMPVVPATAVQISDNKRYVFVVENQKALRRIVETGVDGGEWLEIAKGLTPGEAVVVAGADALSDGVTVRTADGAGASASATAAKASATPAASAAPAH